MLDYEASHVAAAPQSVSVTNEQTNSVSLWLAHTILNTALVDRMVGRGRSAFGTGGGRAATCGEAASDDSDSAVGTTTGGESLRGCFVLGLVCAAGGR